MKSEGWVRGGFGIGYLNGDVRGTFLGIHLLLWVRHKIEDIKSSPDPGSRFKIKGCCNQWGHTRYIPKQCTSVYGLHTFILLLLHAASFIDFLGESLMPDVL